MKLEDLRQYYKACGYSVSVTDLDDGNKVLYAWKGELMVTSRDIQALRLAQPIMVWP